LAAKWSLWFPEATTYEKIHQLNELDFSAEYAENRLSPTLTPCQQNISPKPFKDYAALSNLDWHGHHPSPRHDSNKATFTDAHFPRTFTA
jgi:hypothetical protein